MALEYGPFNGLENAWDAYDFAAYLKLFFGNGVFPNPSNNLQVVTHENMQTKVKVGVGFVEGHKIKNTSDYILQHDLADGVLKRIDRVIMRANFLENKGEIFIKKGTPASSPVAPTLVRNTDYYELALADVMITNGATVITQANITDQRLNTALCGVVATNINQLDTTTLAIQYQSAFEQMTIEQQQDFEAWVASLQDILDENVAATLATRLIEVEGDVSNIDNRVTQHLDDDVAHNRYGVATGTNTLTVTLSPAPTILVEGFSLRFKNTTANTGSVTLNVNSLGAKSLKKQNGNTLVSGNLKANTIYTAVYDGTSFILQGEGGEYGTAVAADVLAGKSIGTENGLVNGTMANRGSMTFTPSNSQQTIPVGYHNGSVVKPIEFFTGDSQFYLDSSIKYTNSTSPEIQSQVIINNTGTYRVSFAISSSDSGFTTYGQIYKGDTPVGILRTNNTTQAIFYTEDLRFEAGEILSIRIYAIFSSYTVYLNQTKISFNEMRPTATKLK